AADAPSAGSAGRCRAAVNLTRAGTPQQGRAGYRHARRLAPARQARGAPGIADRAHPTARARRPAGADGADVSRTDRVQRMTSTGPSAAPAAAQRRPVSVLWIT